MHSLASPFWQQIFFLVSGLYLLWEVWLGWRRGVVRSAVYFGAFERSGFVGIAVGQGVYTICIKMFPAMAFMVSLCAGVFATLCVLLLCLLIGALLFKRTAQQSSALVRLLFGVGGAFFGLLLGLAVLWGAISLVRVSGAMAEISIAGRPSAQAPPLLRSFATLKESIELGSAGKLVESVDVMPPQAYKMIDQIGKLSRDPTAMQRLLDYPGVQQILQNPRIVRLLENPELARASQSANPLAIMRSQAIIDAANDPEVQKLLTNFDYQKALDYAVPTAEASPTPKKKNP